MTFTYAIKTCYLKTFSIRGRASRSEYWWFWLFTWLCLCVTENMSTSEASLIRLTPQADLVRILFYYLGLGLPWTTLSVRRLHDTGHSARWMVAGFSLGWVGRELLERQMYWSASIFIVPGLLLMVQGNR